MWHLKYVQTDVTNAAALVFNNPLNRTFSQAIHRRWYMFTNNNHQTSYTWNKMLAIDSVRIVGAIKINRRRTFVLRNTWRKPVICSFVFEIPTKSTSYDIRVKNNDGYRKLRKQKFQRGKNGIPSFHWSVLGHMTWKHVLLKGSRLREI